METRRGGGGWGVELFCLSTGHFQNARRPLAFKPTGRLAIAAAALCRASRSPIFISMLRRRSFLAFDGQRKGDEGAEAAGWRASERPFRKWISNSSLSLSSLGARERASEQFLLHCLLASTSLLEPRMSLHPALSDRESFGEELERREKRRERTEKGECGCK